MEIKEMNIFQKMSAITDEIITVAKNLTIGTGKNQYKAVSEVDVLNAVKPIEIKFGIYSYPVSRKIIDSKVLTSKSEYNGEVSEKNQLFVRIETNYRFVNIDKPEEYIEITSYGDGVDSQDKATGKAMTYSDKYALLKAYKIETGDDPDQNESESIKKTTQKVTTITATPKQIELLAKAYTGENLEKLLQVNNISKLEEMPMAKANELITKIYKKGEN